ncbi:MAG TPA: hypothetical protein PLB67_02765 [Candidatus Hydrogenedentes bacterium]|jgi:hypothetical protein|nr:hypothetical protein [Candidatus Hydrogenedentota bacterium]MDY0030717.1 hypothetical protein [FCB group bacterium]OQA27753.1 MAG: hypothetical protein BWY59_01009 [Verrucomicrobia bacterium ADurb.Bin345]NLT62630.1 hypothetical protein [Candidatus Hydrogenedentota bacterium]HNV21335.1 hypothetical protein [Candidatus Hydrogenedentota bacterium]
MDKHIIYGVHVTNRMNKATNVQQLFSEYGCNIKTRIGLHDVGKDFCSPSGVILLEMFGDESVCEELRKKLAAIDGIEVQQMIFDHD